MFMRPTNLIKNEIKKIKKLTKINTCKPG
jgi:hypothetical protein